MFRHPGEVTGSGRRRHLSDSAWDAILEAVAVFYWYKPDQARFLRGVLRDHPVILSQLTFGLPKRQVASQLVTVLQADEERYQPVAIDLIERLASFQDTFTHLARLEDRPAKVRDARAALAAGQSVTGQNRRLIEEREQLRERLEEPVRGAPVEALAVTAP